MKDIRVDDLDRKSDERGWLIEVLGGKSLDASHEFGQIHVSVAYPGKIRGNHYHTRKLEWFNVPMGKGLLRLKDLKTGEEKDIIMGGKVIFARCTSLPVSFTLLKISGKQIWYSSSTPTNLLTPMTRTLSTNKSWNKKNPAL